MILSLKLKNVCFSENWRRWQNVLPNGKCKSVNVKSQTWSQRQCEWDKVCQCARVQGWCDQKCVCVGSLDAVSFLSQSKRRIILLCYICLTKLNVKWRIWITEHQYKSSLHSAIEAPKAAPFMWLYLPFIWLVTLFIKLTLLKFIWWQHKENSQTLYQMPDVSVKTWHMKCLTLY